MGERSQPIRTILSTSHLGLYFLLLLFFWLATLYSLIVPITQGEDELAHYRYISFIAQQGRLPVTHEERELAWYRSDWPPLYHLIVGWLVSPVDTTRPYLKDVGQPPQRRLVGEIFYPRLIIYTEDAQWPWQDGILAWRLGRFISILFATLALIFVYLTTLELLEAAHPEDKQVQNRKSKIALAATALLAFTPRYLFTSAMLSDDSLFILLSALFIWLLLRALRSDDRWWLYAVMGLLLGLSIATKYSTGLLPLAVIPVAWWRARQAGRSRWWAAGRVGLAWLFTLIGVSWWFGWIVYHFNTVAEEGWFFGLLSPVLASGPDVSMRRVFAFLGGEAFSGSLRPAAVAEGDFWGWWVYLFQTFWGVPVLEYDPLFPWAYLILLLFCLAALFGLWRYWQQAKLETRLSLALLALIVLLLLPFPILRFFLTFNILETGQGRHLLYPAAQAIPILLVLGWIQLFQESKLRLESVEGGAGEQEGEEPQGVGNTQYAIRNTYNPAKWNISRIAPLPLLLIWSLFLLVYMTVTYPEPLPVRTTTFDPATIPQPLKHNFGEAIQFLGYDFQPDPEQALINLTLFWRALETVEENYRVRVQLTDPAGKVRWSWLSHPLNGLYPTRAWDQGDVIRDTLPLPLAAAPANSYDIQIDLLHEAEATPLNAEPFPIIHFELGKVQPIPNPSTLAGRQYRLWGNEEPVRQRQTLPLSWLPAGEEALAAAGEEPVTEPPSDAWFLTGPDGVPRLPEVTHETNAIFVVGADWPSGDYRLGLAGSPEQSEPVVRVNNEPRLFTLPSELAGQPGWMSVEANFANQIKLIGYQLAARRLQPGDVVTLSLAWQGLQPVLPDAIIFAVLLNEQQEAFGSVDRYPNDYYSPLLWAEGEVVPDAFSLATRPDTPPGVYFLRLGLYQVVDGRPESLTLFQEGQPVDETAVVIGPVKIGGPPPDVMGGPVTPQVSLNQPFGDQITLLGYDLSLQALEEQAKTLKLTLYWRSEGPAQADYTTFLHLRNGAGETVTQKDNPPAGGRYPTSLWDKGEIIVDEMTLPLDQVAPGKYTPVIGLYEFKSGLRVPASGHPDNEIKLAPVVIDE